MNRPQPFNIVACGLTFLALIFCLVTPGACFAEPVDKIKSDGPDSQQNNLIAASVEPVVDVRAEATSTARVDKWRERINAALFESGSISGSKSFFTRSIDSDQPDLLDLNVKRQIESTARSESYRVFSALLLDNGFIKRLRQVLEPFTKPLELYQTESGDLAPAFFGSNNKPMPQNAPATKVFALTLSLSGDNNINLAASIYDSITLSFLDGRYVDLRYALPNQSGNIAIVAEGGDGGYLVYSLNF